MWCALKSFPNIVPCLLDAKDLRTNKLVCIKRVGKKTKELEIGRYLVPESSESLQDPNNHCVPILDAFSDPAHCNISYIVMPLLRPFDDPEFGAIDEVIEFVTQLLEVR